MAALRTDFGKTDVIPLSFAVDALAALADRESERDCFHIGSGQRLRTADVHNAFAEVADAPRAFVLERDGGLGALAWRTYTSAMAHPRAARVRAKAFAALEIPEVALERLAHEYVFDCTDTTELLEGAGVRCPALGSYVGEVGATGARTASSRR